MLYSETRSSSVFLLSFITDLWTLRNVALTILTSQSKNSSRAPACFFFCCQAATDVRFAAGNRLQIFLWLNYELAEGAAKRSTTAQYPKHAV